MAKTTKKYWGAHIANEFVDTIAYLMYVFAAIVLRLSEVRLLLVLWQWGKTLRLAATGGVAKAYGAFFIYFYFLVMHNENMYMNQYG